MPLPPDQAAFILRLTLPTLKNEHQITMRVIQAIPLDGGDFRPDAISRSALDLAWHIVSAENRFLSGIASGVFHDDGNTRPANIANSGELAELYGQQFTTNIGQLQMLTGEDLLRIVDFRGSTRLPAFAYLNFAVHHSIHHRGQLSTYLRPMGAKVPSIYGESYDDAQA